MMKAMTVIALVATAMPVAAANWDEFTFGDFHGGHVLPVVVGPNLFVGDQAPDSGDLVDGFRFSIPLNHLGKISFDVTFSGLKAGEDIGFVWELYGLSELEPCAPTETPYDCVFEPNSLAIQVLESTPGFVDQAPAENIADLVLRSGAYLLADNFFFRNGADDAYLHYEITVEVTAVPLPPALLLFAAATSGLSLLNRHSRHSRVSFKADDV